MTIRISKFSEKQAGEIKKHSSVDVEFGEDTPPDMVKYIIRSLFCEKDRMEIVQSVEFPPNSTIDLESLAKHSRWGMNRG